MCTHSNRQLLADLRSKKPCRVPISQRRGNQGKEAAYTEIQRILQQSGGAEGTAVVDEEEEGEVVSEAEDDPPAGLRASGEPTM